VNKQRYVEFSLLFCVVTFNYFLYFNTFGSGTFQVNLYYLWIKSKELILWYGYTFFVSGRLKLCVFLLSLFYLIRFCWQIWEIIDKKVANRDVVFIIIYSLFLIIIFTIFVISDDNRLFLYVKNKLKWLKLN
jgi:hypothetical protein